MQELKTDRTAAITAHRRGNASVKETLEILFGADAFKIDFLNRCKSMHDVIEVAGENPNDYLIPKDATPRQISRIRHARIDLLCEVAREGKELTTEDKWWYLVYSRPSGSSGGSLFCSGCRVGLAPVGSRLCVCDEETALHLDKHFRDEITAYLENRPA